MPVGFFGADVQAISGVSLSAVKKPETPPRVNVQMNDRSRQNPSSLAREARALAQRNDRREVERGALPAIRLSESGAIRIPRSALDPHGQEYDTDNGSAGHRPLTGSSPHERGKEEAPTKPARTRLHQRARRPPPTTRATGGHRPSQLLPLRRTDRAWTALAPRPPRRPPRLPRPLTRNLQPPRRCREDERQEKRPSADLVTGLVRPDPAKRHSQ